MPYTETAADLDRQILDAVHRRDEWREAGDDARADALQADVDLYRSLRAAQPRRRA